MARMKKPENETQTESIERRTKETVANHANRSEKTSWARKEKNMKKLLDQLEPYDNEILSLMAKKQGIIDSITILRNEMVEECIHPYDQLVTKDGYVECKFCNKKLNPTFNQNN